MATTATPAPRPAPIYLPPTPDDQFALLRRYASGDRSVVSTNPRVTPEQDQRIRPIVARILADAEAAA